MIRNDEGGTMFMDQRQNNLHGAMFATIQNDVVSDDETQNRDSNASSSTTSPRYSSSTGASDFGYMMSPWNPPTPSPWRFPPSPLDNDFGQNGLIGSIVKDEGHIYSLAASGDLLFTGTDSKNIRVWKNLKEFSSFKANSGLVKAIIIWGDMIFTGHQDGKIRVWKPSPNNPSVYKKFGSLPGFTDFVKSSVKPKNYVESSSRKKKSVLRIRHFDAVSCLNLNEEFGLLYSGSWDKTLKIWRIATWKCLESIDAAHDDAINSMVCGFDCLVFTGSADGTVKVWKRECHEKGTKHTMIQLLLKQENAVTALAVSRVWGTVYCGSSDGVIHFWEQENHCRLSEGRVLRGHKMAVLCMAAAGNLVFSGSADKSICVWRREEGGTHMCLSVLTGHTGPLKCLAVEEDDRTSSEADRKWIVYSGSLDKSVKVWRVSEQPPDLNRITHGYIVDYDPQAGDGNAMIGKRV